MHISKDRNIEIIVKREGGGAEPPLVWCKIFLLVAKRHFAVVGRRLRWGGLLDCP